MVYAILLMMLVNMVPVNIFAHSKAVDVKVLTDDEMKNIIGAGSNNGGENTTSRIEKEITSIAILSRKFYNYTVKCQAMSGWESGESTCGNIKTSRTYTGTIYGSLSVGAEASVKDFLKANVSVNVGRSVSASYTNV